MIDKRPSAAVLMSTYNGELFLREQIDSILIQRDVHVTLFIRDDGSNDDTLKIISTYGTQIKLECSENVGVGNSFMNILRTAGCDYDYYAFCDQDDIWMPEKLAKAIEIIHPCKGPVCYCSNQMLINSNGKKIGERYDSDIDTGYMYILSNNPVSGCTMVWNRKLQELLIDDGRFPSAGILKKRIHDVWVAMVASIAGTLVYDANSYILYRQHNGNVVGVRRSSLLHEWKKKIIDPSLRNGRSSLAKEIVEKYMDLIPDKQTIERLKIYAYYQDGWRNKLKLLSDREIRKKSGESMPFLLAKILLNLF